MFEPRDAKTMKDVGKLAKKNLIERFWLGIQDGTGYRDFVYVSDNSHIQLNDWNRNEPNNFNANEDCVEAFFEKKSQLWKWNDIQCDDVRSFFCTREKSSLSQKESSKKTYN